MHRWILLPLALVVVIVVMSTDIQASPVTDRDMKDTSTEHQISKRTTEIWFETLFCIVHFQTDAFKRSIVERSFTLTLNIISNKTNESVWSKDVIVEDGAPMVSVEDDTFVSEPNTSYNLTFTGPNGIGGSEELKCSIVEKDPHVTTFDGLKFNFNGHCSYTLTKSCDSGINPSFEVTADFRARNHKIDQIKTQTFMVAFNVTSDGRQLIRINEDDTVLIKGKPMTPPSADIGNGEGYIDIIDDGIYLYLEELAMSLRWERRIHGLTIGFNDVNLHGKVCGLLGNDDGNPHNDFTLPDGRRTFHAEEFGNSWLIPNSCP